MSRGCWYHKNTSTQRSHGEKIVEGKSLCKMWKNKELRERNERVLRSNTREGKAYMGFILPFLPPQSPPHLVRGGDKGGNVISYSQRFDSVLVSAILLPTSSNSLSLQLKCFRFFFFNYTKRILILNFVVYFIKEKKLCVWIMPLIKKN